MHAACTNRGRIPPRAPPLALRAMADAAFESLGVDELRALLSALGQPVGGAGSAAGLAAQLRQAVPVGEGAEGGDAGAEEAAAVADVDLLPPEHLEHLLTDEERDAFEQQGVRSRQPALS